MSITPVICPQCLAIGIIATRNGPTCWHQLDCGAKWFPSWWNDKDAEPRRLAWLAAKREEK